VRELVVEGAGAVGVATLLAGRAGVTRDSLHCDEVERMLEGWGYKVELVS